MYYIYIVRWSGKEKTWALESDAKAHARSLRSLSLGPKLFRKQVSMEEYGRLLRKNVVYGVSYTPPPRPRDWKQF